MLSTMEKKKLITKHQNPSDPLQVYLNSEAHKVYQNDIPLNVVDPIGQFAFETALLGKPLSLVGKGLLYSLGKAKNFALDKTIGEFNLSYLLNKNKQFNINKIGNLIGKGGESKVYEDLTNPNRVIKESIPIKDNYYKTYTKSRVRRNRNPYYLKERVEGFSNNNDGTKTLYISQEKINPNIIIDDKNIKDPIKLQDYLMGKKGFKRLSVEETTDLPEANVLVGRINHLPAYWQMKGTFFDRGIPSVFSNGKWYMPDAKIGTYKNVQFIRRTLFPKTEKLNSIQQYIDNLLFKRNPITLQNIDNDAVLFKGKNKGIFPLLSKEYNSGIVEGKLDDNFAKYIRQQFIMQNK